MANATSNIITPQPGLVSTNPFLSTAPKTGGTTTATFAPTQANPTNVATGAGAATQPAVTGFSGTPAGGIIPTTSSTPQPQSGIIKLPNPTSNMLTNGQGSITPATNGSSSDPYSTANYYAAHPDANPANNSAAANTYSGGVNGNGQTFPGYVSALGTMSSQPTQNFTQAQTTAAQAAQDLINSTPEQNANVEAATNNLQGLQNNYANQTGIIGNSPIGLSEQGGEQGLLNQQYSSKLGAAQTAVSNALAGNAQEQAAYTGAGNVANTTASGATTQQGTQQSGTATAAGLVSPSLAAPGQSTFNPQTGQFGSMAGSQNGGGIASVGALQTQEQQGAAVQNMEGIYTQAQGLASSLSSAINSSGYNPAQGVGPATTYANGVNQWLQNNSGNPQYQNVANLVSEVANKYAAILNQSGGTPTSVSQVQQQIINGLASGQDIETVLGSLATNAETSINALKGASGTNAVNGTSNNTTFGSFFGS